jgi:glutaredoxin
MTPPPPQSSHLKEEGVKPPHVDGLRLAHELFLKQVGRFENRPCHATMNRIMSGKAKICLALLAMAVFAWLAGPASLWAASEQPVKIYVFWTKGCPHCAQEKEFLAKLAGRDQQIKVITFELIESRANRELFSEVGKELRANVSGVPFTVVGERYITGWLDEESTGARILQAVVEARRTNAPDVVARLRQPLLPPPIPPEKKVLPDRLKLPFFGEIEIKYLSLGLLTVIIGLLDGFNPCAMWVLIFLINLLLGMENRRKMWILGGAFIITSGLVYFLFMTAWLNFLVFVGFIVWVRIAIGGVALGAACYNLREYFTKRAGVCKLSNTERRQRRMDRLKEIVQTRKFILALGGIILLAFAVNLVELICSAGFPVIYLQVLSLTPLPFWQYYLYLAFYIFLYMLDDMIVFVVAMITLEMLGLGTKYKQFSSLVGGVLMLILGLLLIFRPQALMFG